VDRDPGHRLEQARPLPIHCRREHRADLGVHSEELAVEVRHGRVGVICGN
jgi:hypothetical protein